MGEGQGLGPAPIAGACVVAGLGLAWLAMGRMKVRAVVCEKAPSRHAAASLRRARVRRCCWMWRTFSKKSTSASLCVRTASSAKRGWEGKVRTS